jgi:hypothetical protein
MPIERDEFAIHLSSMEELFVRYDARPVAARPLAADARGYLLDEWERVRDARPSTLTVYAPEADRAGTDEGAVATAIRTNLHVYSGPLRRTGRLSRRERIGLGFGVVVMFGCIAVSAAIDRLRTNPIVEGISQGIVLVGWVALWAPAEHFVDGRQRNADDGLVDEDHRQRPRHRDEDPPFAVLGGQARHERSCLAAPSYHRGVTESGPAHR